MLRASNTVPRGPCIPWGSQPFPGGMHTVPLFELTGRELAAVYDMPGQDLGLASDGIYFESPDWCAPRTNAQRNPVLQAEGVDCKCCRSFRWAYIVRIMNEADGRLLKLLHWKLVHRHCGVRSKQAKKSSLGVILAIALHCPRLSIGGVCCRMTLHYYSKAKAGYVLQTVLTRSPLDHCHDLPQRPGTPDPLVPSSFEVMGT
jgi:hypothetical protein